MNLDSYYYIFEEALTEKFCDDLIRYGEEQEILMDLLVK